MVLRMCFFQKEMMMMMIKGVVPQKSITIIKQSQTDSKHSRPLRDVEGEKRDEIRFLLKIYDNQDV